MRLNYSVHTVSTCRLNPQWQQDISLGSTVHLYCNWLPETPLALRTQRSITIIFPFINVDLWKSDPDSAGVHSQWDKLDTVLCYNIKEGRWSPSHMISNRNCQHLNPPINRNKNNDITAAAFNVKTTPIMQQSNGDVPVVLLLALVVWLTGLGTNGRQWRVLKSVYVMSSASQLTKSIKVYVKQAEIDFQISNQIFRLKRFMFQQVCFMLGFIHSSSQLFGPATELMWWKWELMSIENRLITTHYLITHYLITHYLITYRSSLVLDLWFDLLSDSNRFLQTLLDTTSIWFSSVLEVLELMTGKQNEWLTDFRCDLWSWTRGLKYKTILFLLFLFFTK